jgi:hypothetical protein
MIAIKIFKFTGYNNNIRNVIIHIFGNISFISLKLRFEKYKI